MKRFSRIKLAAAVAAAMTGLMASNQASAAAALDAAGGTWVSGAQAGDVLLFPYYTVRDDPNGNPYITTFNITNTDLSNTVIIKFRLRDHKNSDDVLDFLYVMSPGDEVVAWMDRGTNGRPRLNIPLDENTCRVPMAHNGDGVTSIYYNSPAGEVTTEDSLEGHLEVIPVAALPAAGSGGDAVHGAGQDCSTYDNIFLTGTNDGVGGTTIINTQFADEASVGNVLRGSWVITSRNSGYSAGGAAQAVANWDDAVAVGSLMYGQNGLAAVPSRISGSDDQQWDHPHLGDAAVTANIDAGAIGASNVTNNWSVNPGNGVGVDWVVTYFTKYLFRDVDGNYGSDGANAWPNVDPASVVVYDTSVLTSPWQTNDTDGVARCIRVDLSEGAGTLLVDREEQSPTTPIEGGVSPGPAPTVNTVDFCDEAEVFHIVQDGQFRPVLRAATVPTAEIDAAALNQPYGWASIEVNDTATNDPVAVGGFTFTLRDQGTAANSYGSATPHDLVAPTP